MTASHYTGPGQSGMVKTVAKLIAGFAIIALIVAAFILFAASEAGAQTGDHCVTFDGTRLLNEDGNDTGEVRGVFIPGGDYLIELSSIDDSHPESPTQPDEVWLLVANGNIVVGPSTDIADDVTTSVTTVGPVTLPNIDTLQPVHARIGDNINSVDPVSACFVSVAPRVPEVQPLPDPVTPEEPPLTPMQDPVMPEGELPEKPEPLEPTNEETPGEDPEKPATAPEQPDAQTLDDPEPDPEMPSELARTGATSMTLRIALFGWALVFAGWAALGAGRRTASAA